MKAFELQAKETGSDYSAMPGSMQKSLENHTINSAVKAGLISSIGDADGNFIFNHADAGVDALYAIINGHRVRLSSTASQLTADELAEDAGNLTFSGGVSNVAGGGFGKNWFILGLPKGIRLGAVVLNVKPTVAETAAARIGA